MSKYKGKNNARKTLFLPSQKPFHTNMQTETERKFLVKGDFDPGANPGTSIRQAYLCRHPERTVRVRMEGSHGKLTIKGKSDNKGLMRMEWEYYIPAGEAESLLEICEPGRIEKTRYRVGAGDHVFEVDVFHGENHGLVLAEIELRSAGESFARPSWLGKEVTGDPRYYNAMLSQKPYSTWT